MVKLVRLPVSKITDLWCKSQKKSTLAYSKVDICISKQSLYLTIANSSEEEMSVCKIGFFEANMKQKMSGIKLIEIVIFSQPLLGNRTCSWVHIFRN